MRATAKAKKRDQASGVPRPTLRTQQIGGVLGREHQHFESLLTFPAFIFVDGHGRNRFLLRVRNFSEPADPFSPISAFLPPEAQRPSETH